LFIGFYCTRAIVSFRKKKKVGTNALLIHCEWLGVCGFGSCSTDDPGWNIEKKNFDSEWLNVAVKKDNYHLTSSPLSLSLSGASFLYFAVTSLAHPLTSYILHHLF